MSSRTIWHLRCLVAAWLLFCARGLGAEDEALVGVWTVADGLPGNAVSAVAPTREGYLWVGGLNGLTRFDGVRFVRHRLWDGLTSLMIERLLEDRHGRLWIGTRDGGLMVREGGRFRVFTEADGFQGEHILALAEDRTGVIWVGTDAGLLRWDGKFTDVSPPQRVAANSVAFREDTVFAVTDDWRVWERRDRTWRMLPPVGKAGLRFDRIFATRDGTIWAQLYPAGLARLERSAATDEGRWRVFGGESGLPEDYISAVLERANGDLWLGTFERGLFRWRDSRATPAGLNEPPDADGVLALAEDADGNLWAGTRARGLLRLRVPRVRKLAGADIVRIARLALENNGRLWLGGQEGLWFGREGAFTNAPPPPDWLPRWSVPAIVPTSSNGVWFGAIGGGLWRFDPDRQSAPVAQLRGPITRQSVLSLALDRTDGIWFGTGQGGIGRVSGAGQKIFSPPEAAQKRVTLLVADPAGGVWAGTEGAGVLRLEPDGRVSRHLGAASELPGKTIRSLLLDADGVLWFGTPGGLCRWKKARLDVFDTRHGLPEDALASVVDDGAGQLWCSANTRLFRLSKAELEEIAAGRVRITQPLVVGSGDGLDAVPFAGGIAASTMHGPGGTLVLPRIFDVLTLSPGDFHGRPSTPRLGIEEVLLDGEPVKFGSAPTAPLTVPPRRAQVEIRYTAFQWSNPEGLRFRHRLAGMDATWAEAGDQRVARFRRLPPGSYRFEMTASVNGTEWTEPPAALSFVVQPQFWQATWFRALVVAVVAVISGAGFWWRMRALERRRAAQENFSRELIHRQEAERKRIAAELHDSLEQNLLVIKNRAVLALGQPGEVPAKLKESLDEISAVSSGSIEEVRAIAGNLRPHQLDRLGLTRALQAMLRSLGESTGLRLTGDLAEIKGCLGKEAEINLYRIVQESLNNVIKHAQATEARVSITRNGNALRLVVADNGRGLTATPGAIASDHSGFGLAGMAERARLIGGKFHIHSPHAGGTELVVELPIRDTQATNHS